MQMLGGLPSWIEMVAPSTETNVLLRMPPALAADIASPSSSPVWMTCADDGVGGKCRAQQWVTPQPAAKAAAIESVMASAIHGQSSLL